ncbi:tripartite motif-containing protein 59 [Cheilinus undulatus]|uniref:tripartite motif-containing protein 59 n=1 Tax=Cheilinus undulatus TaxID=241271 RepID=UPI001BD289C8|nr:tripartite motif-containing protein 59 [Cheilinus undulatus]XP_041652021.1 tripartite motif-containing protein 59 [Cheilinus undulatus]XP_041652030.1 tripartite motif-containing protein 59 [Cheilinus undulatus]XP_041652041.1 tripartite motif-containing protein 59 [Cheilinus undulatus]
MDNLEEDLTCSVCYSLFSDPRVLPCSHTFCKNCLDNLLQVSTNYSIWRPLRLPLKCPNCRSVVELPPAGIEALPTNVCLRAIIEKYQNESEPRPPPCEEHHRQPLNMYCIQDRQLICGLCLTIGEHQGHPIDDLQAAFIREKQTPSLLLARLSEKRWTQMCELGEQLEQEKARCEGLVRQDRQEVNQFFQTLEAVLALKRHAYLEALDKAGTEVSRAYDPLILRVKELQEEQLDLVSLGSSVEEEDSPLVFLEKVHLFRERVEEFIKTPLPSVINLSVSPRAADFLQQHWPVVTIGSLEEAPIPKLCCCTRCGCVEAGVETETGRDEPENWLWDLKPTSSMVLLGLLLLLVALWVNPVGGASLGFSMLSWFSQVVHGMSSELTTYVWDAVGLAYEVMEATVERWSCWLSSVGEKALQQLAALLKTLKIH